MRWVIILGEDDELARIVGPIAQGVKVERAPERCGCRRSFDASQRIAVSHAPPTIHIVTRRLVWTRRPGPYTDSDGGQSRSPQLAALRHRWGLLRHVAARVLRVRHRLSRDAALWVEAHCATGPLAARTVRVRVVYHAAAGTVSQRTTTGRLQAYAHGAASRSWRGPRRMKTTPRLGNRLVRFRLRSLPGTDQGAQHPRQARCIRRKRAERAHRQRVARRENGRYVDAAAGWTSGRTKSIRGPLRSPSGSTGRALSRVDETVQGPTHPK